MNLVGSTTNSVYVRLILVTRSVCLSEWHCNIRPLPASKSNGSRSGINCRQNEAPSSCSNRVMTALSRLHAGNRTTKAPRHSLHKQASNLQSQPVTSHALKMHRLFPSIMMEHISGPLIQTDWQKSRASNERKMSRSFKDHNIRTA